MTTGVWQTGGPSLSCRVAALIIVRGVHGAIPCLECVADRFLLRYSAKSDCCALLCIALRRFASMWVVFDKPGCLISV